MTILFKFCLAFLIVGFTAIYAQGTIKGKVSDLSSSLPVDADVKLFKQGDSALVKGTKCNASGEFSLDAVPAGTYRLEVSLIEYSTMNVENISLTSGQTVSLDTITLKKQNVSTDEILVEEEKGLIQLTADKKIFNVEKSALTKGGTALDVLKKTPLVDVDINDNVSLRGSQNVKILIDDKPSRFASLKQIPADAIERVELITNPPAKYEAEGVTGIINIVMKKNENLGFQGSLNGGGNYSDYLSGWGGLDISLKKKKTSAFGNFYSGTWDNKSGYSSTTTYLVQPSVLQSSGTGKNHGYWIWAQGGFEYELAQGKNIGFEGSLGTGKWFNNDNGLARNFSSSGSLMDYYTQTSDRNGLWENFTGSLYFNNKINELGREWSGDITFSRNRNEMKMQLNKQDFDSLSMPVNNTPLDQRDTTLMKNYNLNVQTDYTHPLSQTTKIETGYKGTFRTNDNEFKSDTLDYSLNNFVTNTDTKNRFKLSEYINAVYGTFSGSIKDFSYKAGIRVEQTNTTGELLTNNTQFKQNYFDIFPSASISQKIGSANQLQLSYSRRITRPNMWRMNPFYRKWSPRFAMVGNPELKPEYSDSYELSFMFFSPVATITPLVFYRQNHDVISSYNYLQDSIITVTTFRNATGSKSYGLDLLINSRALSWFNLNGTFSFYDTKFDSDPGLTDYASEDGFTWKANIRSTFTFTNLFNLELYYSYTGKKINAQGTEVPTQNFDIGISKSFLNDALTVSLKASDIFDTSQWGQDINTSEYRQTSDHDWSSRQASLNLSFRFGNTKDYLQKNKKVKQNQNEKSDQQDGNNGR
ncbi:MAG: TonB-dependent receptor [Ignavibacteria bacterium]|nr:TonB-dependent receptor [Ignavibacteria bacterium]